LARPGGGGASRRCCGLGLVVAADTSGARVVAIVGAWEHVLKSVITGMAGWAKHYREIPSKRKRGYLRRFPQRYRKLLPYLAVSRVCLTVECVAHLLGGLNIEKLIVDDKLLPKLNPGANTLPESSAVRSRHYRVLVTLADNLANYARVMLEEDPAKAWQAIKGLEK
jgi:hypothetical protein